MSKSISQTHSIFEQPWWLDATAPNQWDAVEIEESGRVMARLPFVFKKKYGLRIIGQPELTPTLGPWIEDQGESHMEKIDREKDLFNKLIAKLPKFDVFMQNFHPSVTNWLPFYWKGYTQTTHYTYILKDIKDSERTYAGMSKSTKRNIRTATKQVEVLQDPTVDQVLDMATLTFARQGKSLPYPRELLERIDDAITLHGKKVSLASVDADNQMHTALYAVGDERAAYLIVTGSDPNFRKSKSGQLLQWKGIQAAAEFTDVFDCEGSMLEGVEEFYRKFGSIQTPYHSISKYSRIGAGAMAVRNIL